MSEECVIVDCVEKSPVSSPPLKKLKQSRLPFAPVNSASPKQVEKSSEKKRKHSGSDSLSGTPKTPRSESKDENSLTKEKGLLSTEKSFKEKKATSEPSEEIEVVGKKRGRPTGSKNKSKDGSLNTSQDDSSPVGKKGRKSVSKLDTSYDGEKIPQAGEEKLNAGGNPSPNIDKPVDSLPKVQEDRETNDDSTKLQSKSDSSQKLDCSTCEDTRDSVQSVDIKGEDTKDSVLSVNSKDEDTKNSVLSHDSKDEDTKSIVQSVEKDKGDTKNTVQTADNKVKESQVAAVESEKSSEVVDKKDKKSKDGDVEIKMSSKTVDDKDKESQDAAVEIEKSSEAVDKKDKQSKDADVEIEKSSMTVDDKDKESQDAAVEIEKNSKAVDNKEKKSQDAAVEIKKSSEAVDKKDKESKEAAVEIKKSCKTVDDKDKVSQDATVKIEKSCQAVDNKEKKSQDAAVEIKKISEANTSIDQGSSCGSENAVTPKASEEIKGNKKRGRPPGAKNKPKNESFTSPQASDSPSFDSADGAKKDTSLSKSSLTPQDNNTPKRGRGRPAGSLNRSKSRSSLNASVCSNPSEDEGFSSADNTPVSSEKRSRSIMDLLASLSSKKKDSSQVVEKSTCQKTDDDGKSDISKNDGHAAENCKGEKVEEITIKDDDDKDIEDGKVESKQNVAEMNSKENLNKSIDSTGVTMKDDLNKTSSPGSSLDVTRSPTSNPKATPTSGSKLNLLKKTKKLTPKQKEREAAKLLRMEEMAKQKLEKEKLQQEKMAEKERLKKQKEEEKRQKEEEKRLKEEEKQKQKEEIKKKRLEELDAKKLKKEEELRKKEEEKQKKLEELQKKEEEKQKKLEEQQRIEDEKRRQSDKLKNKFASFFVAKKKEAECVAKSTEGPFEDFQVKEDMQLAPVVRKMLSEEQVANLDKFMATSCEDKTKMYINILQSGTYVKCKSEKTGPSRMKLSVDDDDDDNDEDDIMVIDDSDDDDVGSCSAMIQDPAASQSQAKKHKAKLLKFCENQRPAYWGTWSKKSSVVSGRRPFAQDEIFNYEYDSDDDWEEEETGESLSDSEGEEKEEKEEGDQYDIDNDFFVPHGYLSDDEGKSDQEEDVAEGPAKSKETDRALNTEQLKQKQAEFEEEMKQKTKVLKPRIIGCLWLADENNNPAYDQLMKVLGPHRAVTLCSDLPIGSRLRGVGVPKETGDADMEGKRGNFKRYEKTFPEDAVPALIKLLHGNRHGKAKLCHEFVDYWRKFTSGTLDENMINHTPAKTSETRTVYLSKSKVMAKIQELGSWKQCFDEAKSRNVTCWYVSKKAKEEYGMDELGLTNSWIYISKLLSDKKEEGENEEDTSKRNKILPITAFTKKIPSTPSSANTSPSSTPSSTPINSHLTKSESIVSLNGTPSETLSTQISTPSSAGDNTPSRLQPVSSKKSKKKNLFAAKKPESSTPQKGSIITYFKKSKGNSPKPSKNKSQDNNSISREESDVIVLE